MNQQELQDLKAEQERLRSEMLALFIDFPFKQGFYAKIMGTTHSSICRKISDGDTNKYHHFLEEEVKKAKAYIIEKSKTLQNDFVAIYEDFPFPYAVWAEVIGTTHTTVGKKLSGKSLNKNYHFTQAEVDKAKTYIKEKAALYFI